MSSRKTAKPVEQLVKHVRCAVYTRKSTEEEEEEPRRGGIDDLSDGDGPRSDRGTNPLPESYWADYPGGKP